MVPCCPQGFRSSPPSFCAIVGMCLCPSGSLLMGVWRLRQLQALPSPKVEKTSFFFPYASLSLRYQKTCSLPVLSFIYHWSELGYMLPLNQPMGNSRGHHVEIGSDPLGWRRTTSLLKHKAPWALKPLRLLSGRKENKAGGATDKVGIAFGYPDLSLFQIEVCNGYSV